MLRSALSSIRGTVGVHSVRVVLCGGGHSLAQLQLAQHRVLSVAWTDAVVDTPLAMGREWLILELHSLGLKLNWLLAPQVTMSHSRGLLPEGPRTPRLSSLDVFCSVL